MFVFVFVFVTLSYCGRHYGMTFMNQIVPLMSFILLFISSSVISTSNSSLSLSLSPVKGIGVMSGIAGWKLCFAFLAVFDVKWKTKKITMVDFSATNALHVLRRAQMLVKNSCCPMLQASGHERLFFSSTASTCFYTKIPLQRTILSFAIAQFYSVWRANKSDLLTYLNIR